MTGLLSSWRLSAGRIIGLLPWLGWSTGLSLAALLAACTQAEPPKVGSGPIKASERCPLGPDDLIPEVPLPDDKLKAFEGCVGRHASNAEHVQAAGWVRDWYLASACVHKCDPKGLGNVAHESMWKGLRYVVAVTLPTGDSVDSSCRQAQRNVLVAVDERMNHFAGWRAVAGPQCNSLMRMEATMKKIAEANQYRDRLAQSITAFTSKGLR